MIKINKTTPSNMMGFFRKQSYLEFSNIKAIPQIHGRYLSSVDSKMYVYNFKSFVNMYLNTKISDPKFDPNDPTRLQVGSDGYKALEAYSKTIYGSAVIAEMIFDQVKYKNFKIMQGSKKSASGGTSKLGSSIFFPKIFPATSRFSVGGQPIDYLAVIHHEFYHTTLWQGYTSKEVTLHEEQNAVIYAENPVRIYNGFEPRYTYYKTKKDQSINIVTGEQKSGKFTVNRYNIRELVPLGDKDALK